MKRSCDARRPVPASKRRPNVSHCPTMVLRNPRSPARRTPTAPNVVHVARDHVVGADGNVAAGRGELRVEEAPKPHVEQRCGGHGHWRGRRGGVSTIVPPEKDTRPTAAPPVMRSGAYKKVCTAKARCRTHHGAGRREVELHSVALRVDRRKRAVRGRPPVGAPLRVRVRHVHTHREVRVDGHEAARSRSRGTHTPSGRRDAAAPTDVFPVENIVTVAHGESGPGGVSVTLALPWETWNLKPAKEAAQVREEARRRC